MSDTIAAIATALGNSGISIIRISGSDAFNIIKKIFKPKNEAFNIEEVKSHTIHYGVITDGDKEIDEVLISFMKAPNTYTTENIAEINCHGGIIVTKKILELVLKNGVRPAKPGEFTERAFLNGRIDLSQAEAVIEVINAKNKNALNTAVGQLRGNISEKIKSLRERILYHVAFIESVLDDPEHLSFDGYDEKISEDLEDIKNQITLLLKNAENGRMIKEGIKTVILGKPNAGKSSFLNALMGEERAIVTDIEGTTRDTLEETINLSGISLNIVDTAGIRETEDIIEKIGIEKAISASEDADLIIYIVDGSKPIDNNDKIILNMIKEKKSIILINKIDLDTDNMCGLIKEDIEKEVENSTILEISAKESLGIDNFTEVIKGMFFTGDISYNDEVYITSLRQKTNLENALNSINLVINAKEAAMPEDFYSIDLSAAYEELGFIIGESVEDDLVDKIFREFCTGK